MKKKLTNQLTKVLMEAFELDFIPRVSKTLNSDCLVLSHKKSGKVALMGVMIDSEGIELVKAYTIDVQRWAWAADEGFTLEQLIETDCGKVFCPVDLDNLAKELM